LRNLTTIFIDQSHGQFVFAAGFRRVDHNPKRQASAERRWISRTVNASYTAAQNVK
jgi:hypothetical protein